MTSADNSAENNPSLFTMLLAAVAVLLVVVVTASLFIFPPTSRSELVTNASVEVIQLQTTSWDDFGNHVGSSSQLAERDAAVSDSLADNEIKYQVLYSNEEQIVFSLQSGGRDDPYPTVTVVMDEGEIVSVSCNVIGASCEERPALKPYL